MNSLLALLLTTGFLMVILIILLIVSTLNPVKHKSIRVKDDLKKIKQKIYEED